MTYLFKFKQKIIFSTMHKRNENIQEILYLLYSPFKIPNLEEGNV